MGAQLSGLLGPVALASIPGLHVCVLLSGQEKEHSLGRLCSMELQHLGCCWRGEHPGQACAQPGKQGQGKDPKQELAFSGSPECFITNPQNWVCEGNAKKGQDSHLHLNLWLQSPVHCGNFQLASQSRLTFVTHISPHGVSAPLLLS